MIPSEVQYCSDASNIAVGKGKGIVAGQRCEAAVSRSEVRDYYLRQDNVAIKQSLDTSQGLPRFIVVSHELKPGVVDSTVLPKHTVDSMYCSDLDAFQCSWCLETSMNDEVFHNFIKGLSATTYVSSRFALPKDRVVEIVGVGVANASRHFTKREWETAVSNSPEILQYEDASCSFLVSWLFPYFHLIYLHSFLFRSCSVYAALMQRSV